MTSITALSTLMVPTVGSLLANGDAVGQLGYGGTAPSGTDWTSAIQSAINSLAANSTGAVLIWDGAWGVSSTILLPSNFSIVCASPACGAILRVNSNCPLISNSGSFPNDASASKQNTFGKLDPAHGSVNAYRILNSAFFANANISVVGGTWNGNRLHQSQRYSTTYGMNTIISFGGVNGFVIDSINTLSSSCFGFLFTNCQNGAIRRPNIDNSPIVFPCTDGMDICGPCFNIRVENVLAHCGDDNVAFCSDTSAVASIDGFVGAPGGTFQAGVNWPCSGATTNCTLDGLVFSRGAENVANIGGVRVLSTVSRVDDILVRNVSGVTTSQCFIASDIAGQAQINGQGNFGRIVFEDLCVDFSSPGVGASSMFDIDAYFEHLIIHGLRITNPTNIPQMLLTSASNNGPAILDIEGSIEITAAGTNNAKPILEMDGSSSIVRCKFTRNVDPSFTAVAAPLININSSVAQPSVIDVDVVWDRATNIINLTNGAPNTIIMRGAHTNANGGSPLAIASGKTVKNGIYLDLAFVGANAFKSGAGSLTNDSMSSFAAGDHFAD